jgi:hypothetical protein
MQDVSSVVASLHQEDDDIDADLQSLIDEASHNLQGQISSPVWFAYGGLVLCRVFKAFFHQHMIEENPHDKALEWGFAIG